jgi:hypothetical protein
MYRKSIDQHKKENLNTYLKSTLLKGSVKLKYKYPPISELVNDNQKILKVRKILKLREEFKEILFIKVQNYNKTPKNRFFLAILLANQSSDLLVILAKNQNNFMKDFKLIQYPIYPQFHRIGLLCLIEIIDFNQISASLQSLKEFKSLFRKKLETLKNI